MGGPAGNIRTVTRPWLHSSVPSSLSRWGDGFALLPEKWRSVWKQPERKLSALFRFGRDLFGPIEGNTRRKIEISSDCWQDSTATMLTKSSRLANCITPPRSGLALT